MRKRESEQLSGNRRAAAVLGAALLVATTLAAYYPAVHAGYIWDDDFYVTKNTLLTAPDGLYRIWFSLDSPSQYFPLVYTSFRLERALWGLNPLGYHVVNILFHTANALLLWLLLSRLRIRGAWLAAAAFALHPVNVESVAWITERKNVLTLFFSLLTMLAWVRFVDTGSRRIYAAAFVLYMLALFAKTTAATLPAAMLLVLWLRSVRIDLKRLIQVVPFVVWGIVMGLVTVWWERYHQGTQGPEFAMTPVERILVAGRALWFYAGKLVWPSNLAFSYGKWEVNQSEPVQYVWLLGLIIVAAALFIWRRRVGRGPIAAAVFFAVIPIPMLGFFSLYTFRYSYMADHYQYVSAIGLISLFAAALSREWAPNLTARRVQTLLAASLLIALGVLTWNQCRAYRDPETLWRCTVANSPRAAIAHVSLGRIALDRGELEEAFRKFRTALKIDPKMPEAHNNLGVALYGKGDLAGAVRELTVAARTDPAYVDPRVNLVAVYLSREEFARAESEARAAIGINPNLVEAHSNLGIALAQQGKLDEAVGHFREAVRLDPTNPDSRRNLDHALSLRR